MLETFAFNEEQLAAIDGLIPMTQEVFESILERCNELGSAADKIFYRLLQSSAALTDVYGQKLEKELDEKYPDTELPEETPEERQAAWERLCARIRGGVWGGCDLKYR